MSSNHSPHRPRVWLFLGLLVAALLAVILVLSLRKRAESSDGSASSGPSDTTNVRANPAGPSSKEAIFRPALDAAFSRRDSRQRSVEFATTFQRWLKADEAGALDYLRKLPHDSAEFTQGLGFALRAIGEVDPEHALRLAVELVTTREQRMFYNSLFADWAKRDPALAAQRIDLVPADAGRENAVRAVAETWASADFSSAYHWAKSLSGPERLAGLESVLVTLAAADPTRAAELARESLQGAALERTLRTALQSLLQSDPTAAATLVPLLPVGPSQNSAAATVARALAAKNPTDALQWARGLSAATARERATTVVFETWAANDAAAARQYVQNLPPDATQQNAAVAVARASGGTNPEAAIAWAEGLPATQTRALALSAIVDSWAQHDAAAAARWATGPAAEALGEYGHSSLNAALSYWVLQDAGAVQDFVRALPASRQAAAATFVAPLLAQRDPAATVSWAAMLTDPGARDGAVTAAYLRWRENAPQAAQAWLETAALASEVKERLRTAR